MAGADKFRQCCGGGAPASNEIVLSILLLNDVMRPVHKHNLLLADDLRP